jgi:hypothetical protein
VISYTRTLLHLTEKQVRWETMIFLDLCWFVRFWNSSIM